MTKILIADDDPGARAVLRRFLAPLGCEILEAGDGEETLGLARAHQPGLVLLDICMPKKNGISVLNELVPEMPGTGFFIITGNEDEAVACECLESGAFDYFTKPLDLDILMKTLKGRLSVCNKAL